MFLALRLQLGCDHGASHRADRRVCLGEAEGKSPAEAPEDCGGSDRSTSGSAVSGALGRDLFEPRQTKLKQPALLYYPSLQIIRADRSGSHPVAFTRNHCCSVG